MTLQAVKQFLHDVEEKIVVPPGTAVWPILSFKRQYGLTLFIRAYNRAVTLQEYIACDTVRLASSVSRSFNNEAPLSEAIPWSPCNLLAASTLLRRLEAQYPTAKVRHGLCLMHDLERTLFLGLFVENNPIWVHLEPNDSIEDILLLAKKAASLYQ